MGTQVTIFNSSSKKVMFVGMEERCGVRCWFRKGC